MTQDEQHLKLLSVFHFVVAGMAVLFALFPIIHLVVGIAMVSGAIADAGDDEFPRFIGWFFIAFSATWIMVGLAFATALAIAGRGLMARRHYAYCFVMACIACAFMPFGTVLGVLTVIFLSRESVKALFGSPSVPGSPPGQGVAGTGA